MSDYLNNLVAKSLNRAEVVQPRLASRFEPQSHGGLTADVSPTDFEHTQDGHSVGATPSEHPFNINTPVRNSADMLPPRISLEQSAGTPSPTSDGSADQYTRRHSSSPGGAPSVPPPNNAAAQEKQLPLEQDIRRIHDELVALRAVVHARHAGQTESVLEPGAQLLTPASDISQDRVASLTGSAAPSPAGPTAPQERAPTIKITIGRVDVRAITPAQPAPRRAPAPRAPALSLDDYLKRREGGKR